MKAMKTQSKTDSQMTIIFDKGTLILDEDVNFDLKSVIYVHRFPHEMNNKQVKSVRALIHALTGPSR